jgi:membrane associated rhomboid family serine protease
MFFILPVGVDYRAQRYPVVTFTLMGINTLVYLISLFVEAGERGDPEVLTWWQQTFWLIPLQSHWYAYFTSLFVHAGFFHLLGNMIYLFLFGSCVEDIIGRWRYGLFYLLGGLTADFAYIGFDPEHFSSDIPLGGASGAIFACMGGFVLLLPKRRVEFKYFYWLIWRASAGEFFLPAWLVLSFWFLKDLVFAILGNLAGHIGGGIAFGAHAGGFVGGLAMILAYKLVSRQRERKQQEREAQARLANQRLVYLYDGGAQAGPFTLLQVKQMLNLGSVSQDALYWGEGMPDWRPVLELTPKR